MPEFNSPENFDFQGPAKWPEWQDQFDMFPIETKLEKEEQIVQISSVVSATGREQRQQLCQCSGQYLTTNSNQFVNVHASSEHYFLGYVQCEDYDPAWRVTLRSWAFEFKIEHWTSKNCAEYGAEPYALGVARRVPIPLQPNVKEDLDRLQAALVILPITKLLYI